MNAVDNLHHLLHKNKSVFSVTTLALCRPESRCLVNVFFCLGNPDTAPYSCRSDFADEMAPTSWILRQIQPIVVRPKSARKRQSPLYNSSTLYSSYIPLALVISARTVDLLVCLPDRRIQMNDRAVSRQISPLKPFLCF